MATRMLGIVSVLVGLVGVMAASTTALEPTLLSARGGQ